MTNAGAWAGRDVSGPARVESPQRLFPSDLSGGSHGWPFGTAASEPNACTASCTAGISLGELGGLLAARATMGERWEAAAVLQLS
jgi:hypothetical protein